MLLIIGFIFSVTKSQSFMHEFGATISLITANISTPRPLWHKAAETFLAHGLHGGAKIISKALQEKT